MDGDPLANLTAAYLESSGPSSSIYDRHERNAQCLIERLTEAKADGVVLAAPSFCDPALLDRPRYQAALDREGIPYTAFKYAENTGQLGAIREQVGTFAESIRLWGDAPPTPTREDPIMTQTEPKASPGPPPNQKEESMRLQKQMLSGYFDEVAQAAEGGKKVVYTFVPGNLTELIRVFDLVPIYPEINALQNGMRKLSDGYIAEAERHGFSEDVCTYVKCDVGMMLKGNIGPTGKPIPPPDLLLLSYTGCFVFMKWFENLKTLYNCPAVMLHVPYQADGEITDEMREYVVRQIREDLIPALEKVSGVPYDEEKLRARLEQSARAEDGLVRALESARRRPSPIDAYFGAVHYVGPIFTAFRGTEDCVRYYDHLNREIDERVGPGAGAGHPRGPHGRAALPPGGGRAAQLDPLPGLLEAVLRPGRGGGGLQLHQGGRAVRPWVPPRPRPASGDPGRVLHGVLHEPEPLRPHPAPGPLRGVVRRGRVPHPLREELQLILRGAAPHPAGDRGAHGQAGRVHRVRPGGLAVLLQRQPQEPSGELLPDDRAETRRGGDGMSIFLGIDLGSTTTKAVLLDENETVLGRGITNTRSDYHVATSVAEKEAEISARFTTLQRAASDTGGAAAPATGALTELEDFFAQESFAFRLRRLRVLALGAARERGGDRVERLEKALNDVFDTIEEETAGTPGFARRLRHSFFRDIVGARFMSLAEQRGGAFSLDFEDLMGIYDVVILQEENTVLDLDFGETLMRSPVIKTGNGGLARAVETAARARFEPANMVGTGYGRQRLPFRPDQIRSEILCHGLGAHFMFPGTRTVLDIGGQDTKAIQIDDSGVATNFQMNDRCAAGCGRYLGYVADELNISLDELGPLALEAQRTVSISSTCTVFAGAELRERLELGERREDILAGLHRAIVLRAMSLLARSGGVQDEFTFTGGVARNPAVVKELTALTGENYGERTMNIHRDSIYTGALGAALYARRGTDPDEPTKGKQS